MYVLRFFLHLELAQEKAIAYINLSASDKGPRHLDEVDAMKKLTRKEEVRHALENAKQQEIFGRYDLAQKWEARAAEMAKGDPYKFINATR